MFATVGAIVCEIKMSLNMVSDILLPRGNLPTLETLETTIRPHTELIYLLLKLC